MNELEMRIQQLVREVEKWKQLAVKAADKACFECDTFVDRNCGKCPVREVREAAGKECELYENHCIKSAKSAKQCGY